VRELVRCLVTDDFDGPMVFDADALNVVGSAIEALGAYEGPLVLTPHPGEAQRLLGRTVTADEDARVACAHEIQRRSGATCVLKGLGTVVTDGERTYINETGNAGMATAGAGDVLTGILGAYLAYSVHTHESGWSTFDAVAAAVHVHGLAGDLAAREHGMRGVVASDVIDFLPAAQLAFEGPGA
jgi:NAD(P)H-hydrate epimerase